MHGAASPLFTFAADPDLVRWAWCIAGTPQPGVTVGYWLLLPPMTPGTHTLHYGSPTWGQDITHQITVLTGN